jgi:tRNA_anti-like
METCFNCGREIGDSETPMMLGNEVVCPQCHHAMSGGTLAQLADAAHRPPPLPRRRKPPQSLAAMNATAIIAAVAALFIFFGIVGIIASRQNQSSDGSALKPAASVEQQKVYDVDAQKLIALYHENEVEADAMKGKLMDLHGMVSKIRKDAFGRPLVELYGIDRYGFATVNCYFPRGEETEQLSALRSGQRVIIRGRCKGMILNDVVVDDCSFP